MACEYFKDFAARVSVTSPEVARVVAATCLVVSSKYNETVVLSADWASQVTGGCAQPEDIVTLERLLLVSLDWDLDRTTAAEVARVLLSMWAPGHDFDEFLKESDCFANACYPAASLWESGPLAIAVASVCCVFVQRKLADYRDAWLQFATSKVPVKRDEVLDLCVKVRTHLLEMYGSDDDTDCGSPGLERMQSI